MALSGGPSSGALRRRQRRGPEAVEPGRAARLQALRVLPRRRRACWARSTWSIGRGAVGRRPPVEAPRRRRHHVHRLVPRSGMDIYKHFATERPEAGHLRDGRQEPDDRHEERRPGQGDGRRAASGVRVRRTEVLRVLARVRGARGLRRLPGPAEDEDREDQGRQPDPSATSTSGPIINEPAHGDVRGGRRGGAQERQRSSPAGSASPRATSRAGLFVEPTVVEAPDDSWIWKKELFVPFVAVAPFDELDEAIEKANDTEYGLTAGLLQRGRGRGRRVARPDPGGRAST